MLINLRLYSVKIERNGLRSTTTSRQHTAQLTCSMLFAARRRTQLIKTLRTCRSFVSDDTKHNKYQRFYDIGQSARDLSVFSVLSLYIVSFYRLGSCAKESGRAHPVSRRCTYIFFFEIVL